MEEHIRTVVDLLNQWGWIPMLIVYVGVIVTILVENQNPTKTISWILVIVFCPFLGLILYYLFGQKFSRVQKIKKINQEQASKLTREFKRLEPKMELSLQNIQERIGDFSRVYAYLKNERLSTPTLTNEVKLLVNGEGKFPI